MPSRIKSPLLPRVNKAEHLFVSYRSSEMDEERVSSEESVPAQDKQNPHDESKGSMFHVTSGPGHHLVDVDNEKLKEFDNTSVNVHEVSVDPISITMVSFLALILLTFVIVFMDDIGLGSLIANIQNRL
jgi:hypothetical protein